MTNPRASTLAHAGITEPVIGAFFEVFRELGHGFAEIVYRRAMAVALRDRGIAVDEEVPLTVRFRGATIGSFWADLVVASTVIVEVKATAAIDPYAEAQLLNYLKVAGGGVGLILNFGRRADFKRMVMGNPEASLPLLSQNRTDPKNISPYGACADPCPSQTND